MSVLNLDKKRILNKQVSEHISRSTRTKSTLSQVSTHSSRKPGTARSLQTFTKTFDDNVNCPSLPEPLQRLNLDSPRISFNNIEFKASKESAPILGPMTLLIHPH